MKMVTIKMRLKSSSMFKVLLGAMLVVLMSQLSGCLYPERFYIEYDEEVKLHDGKIIVVHIKRRYRRDGSLAGYFSRHPEFAWQGPVEITWDTGFPNVGKKTVQMKGFALIDKVDNEWWLSGLDRGYSNSPMFDGTPYQDICNVVNTVVCIVSLNDQGVFKKNILKSDFPKVFKTNILQVKGRKNYSGIPPYDLNNTLVSWENKIKINQEQDENWAKLQKSYIFQE